jgi:large subunit ribosomal protein L13
MERDGRVSNELMVEAIRRRKESKPRGLRYRKKMNRTTNPSFKTTDPKWYVVDAAGIPVGRLAAQVAQVLRGKHKPTFAYNADGGDFVIVINAGKAVLTGNKKDELIYWHTMWPDGLRNISRGKFLDEKPEAFVEKVVWGMLPKTKLGKQIYKKLKVYAGEEHPHGAQNPEVLSIKKEARKA